MFVTSVKLAPGWSVTIAPRLIGVPVAATPGLVPHDEVPAAAEAGPEAAAGAVPEALVAGAAPELLLLLLQPARAPPTAMAATAATASRDRRCLYLLICFPY